MPLRPVDALFRTLLTNFERCDGGCRAGNATGSSGCDHQKHEESEGPQRSALAV
jgi:hypothetical protein